MPTKVIASDVMNGPSIKLINGIPKSGVANNI